MLPQLPQSLSLVPAVRHVSSLLGGIGLALSTLSPALAVSLAAGPQDQPEVRPSTCPAPVLSRLTRHRVVAGETVESIAQQYGLLPATVMGLNASAQAGALPAGQELLIPPYNGIRVTTTAGQTWQQVAQAYNSRADVLFEVNGCVSTVPDSIFVPGVNWFPGVRTAANPDAPTARSSPLQGYPLPGRSEIIVNYGWQPDPNQDQLVFNTGVALASPVNTPVLAVGDGTVAFAGSDQVYGNLVVVNHAQGLQTRYANLDAIDVTVGQGVKQGAQLGIVGPGSEAASSFLFFEVRLNSTMGWVAQDPQDFLPTMALR
ncbi:MAG: M23 family metallopeptidase [Leptolyngbyaceae cyanobacterium SM2_3_12]|nr:M23 family metallopeptidase [Leptolyngbyaceae cyanobacterium SM2_3_12]